MWYNIKIGQAVTTDRKENLMKAFILALALIAALQGFSAPIFGAQYKANYPINEKANIFPSGYFDGFEIVAD
jgi:hypothetical protein